MQRKRKLKNKRDSIGYLTPGKIEDMAYKLNERDIEILKLIKKFKYINTEQLYKLIPSVGNYPAFNSLATGIGLLNKRIRLLYDCYFINKDVPKVGYGEGTSQQYCWLDKGGSYILDEDLSLRVSKKLPQNYIHYSLITDTFIYLKQFNNTTKQVQYFREEQKLYTIDLIPDIITVYKNTPILIEIDRCYKKEKLELEKINKYSSWIHSFAWLKEEWTAFTNDIEPRIIYLIDDNRRYWKSRLNRLKEGTKLLDININFIPLSKIYTDSNIF